MSEEQAKLNDIHKKLIEDHNSTSANYRSVQQELATRIVDC